MRNFVIPVLAVALAVAAVQSNQEHVSLTLLSVTDLHGNIYPIDYATNQPDERGLAKIATLIRQVRAESPYVMLLNSGDTLAGTALSFYQAKHAASQPAPIITAMNSLGFDAMVLGNHEYDFGWPIMLAAARDSRFPWLAANAAPPPGRPAFYQPYLMKELGGVRVAVLGLTTTAIPNWDDPAAQRRRITLSDPLSAARRWVPILREREHADIVVAVLHMGVEENPETGARAPGQTENENLALSIARQIPGIDVMLLGHTHRQVTSLTIHGVLLTQAAAWGRSLARVDLTFDATAGHRRVVSKLARILPVAGIAPDPEILRLTAPLHEATQHWLEQPIGTSRRDYRAGPERFRPTALLDFVQRVQLEAGHADVSLTESLAPTAHVPAGQVTVRDIFGLYGVEKKLVALVITGAQLRAVLEQSARYFRQVEPGRPPDTWVNPDFPSYNYYMAYGVDYDLDASKPPGSRIVNLRYKGQPVTDDRRFRLVTNNYLANGTAEYSMLSDSKVLWRSKADLRELLLAWMRKHRKLPESTAVNWRLLQAD